MTKKILTKSEIQKEMQKQMDALANRLELEGDVFVGEPFIVDDNGKVSWSMRRLTGDGLPENAKIEFAKLVYQYSQIVDLSVDN